MPLWSRTQNADGTWSDWQVLNDYFCPGDAPLLAAIQREWTNLKPQPSDIALQPNTGWVIATVPTVAMAADAPRLHAAVLFGADGRHPRHASGLSLGVGRRQPHRHERPRHARTPTRR